MRRKITASASDGDAAEGEPDSLYDVLGIRETATTEEIKRAYYRLVRQYRPNEHPEKFQRFNEAHHTLSDPRRRGEYDQTRRSSRRVQVLLDQAAASIDKDKQKAVTLLKNAIAIAPDMTRPRYLLAYALMRLDEHNIAERQYRWLLREMPRDETIRFRMARCLFNQNRLQEAERELMKAFYLNPRYHDAMMLSAKIFEAKGERGWAIRVLEKAIANDGQENYADLEALMRLFVLHLQAEDVEAAEAVAQRIVAVIPEDEAQATHALLRLMTRATEYFNDGSDRMALGLVRVATRIERATPEKREEIAGFERTILLTIEARRICADPLVDSSLRDLLELKYVDHSPDPIREAKMDEAILALQNRILDDPRALAGAVEYLRREYRNVAADQEGLLQEIVLRAAKRLELLSTGTRVTQDGRSPFVMPGARGDQKRGVLRIFRGRRGSAESHP